MLLTSSEKSIYAKISTMYGRRLKSNDYRQLLRCQSVSEVAAYLKNAPQYKEALENADENLIHRGELETILRRTVFEEYLRICKFQSSGTEPFYRYYILQAEIEQILSSISYINENKEGQYLSQLPVYFNHYAQFDLFKLAKAQNYDDVLETLGKTPYKQVLEKFRPEENAPVDITAIDFALRSYFYSTVMDMIQKSVPGKAKKQLQNFYTLRLEFANIISIIRFKQFSNVPKEYIMQNLFAIPHGLNAAKIDQLIDAKDFSEVKAILSHTRYGKFFNMYHCATIDAYRQNARYFFAKRFIRFSFDSHVTLAAYLVLREVELRNITTIIEGIRYKISPLEISNYLIGQENL